MKEINRHFRVSLDTVTYSIPKIGKGFVGDTIDSVSIQVHHVHSPAEINHVPSTEESKVESNESTKETEVQHHEPNPIVDEVKLHETEVKTHETEVQPVCSRVARPGGFLPRRAQCGGVSVGGAAAEDALAESVTKRNRNSLFERAVLCGTLDDMELEQTGFINGN